MELELVMKQIEKFLTLEGAQVLALKGAWGVGKTYTWASYIEQNKKMVGEFRYSYVSLFGLNSVEEVKRSVFENMIKADMIGKSPSVETLRDNKLGFVEHLTRRATGAARSLPVLQDFSAAFDSMAFMSIRNTLVCLDDVERRGKDLELRELLGLVTLLKEQRHCKIVLLLNDSEEGLDEYTKYREKVVDFELSFAPSSFECAAIAFGSQESSYANIRRNCESLDIRNIRVLKKLKSIFDSAVELARDFHPSVHNQIAHTLPLFAKSLYARTEEFPPITFVCDGNFLAMALARKDNKEKTIEDTWSLALSVYGYLETDELDRCLLASLERGFFVDREFLAVVRSKHEASVAQDKENSFSKAWERFHGSFNDDSTQFVSELCESFKIGARHINLGNMNSTVEILRELGESERADEMIEVYINAFRDTPDLFNLSESDTFRSVKDERTRKRFSEAYFEFSNTPSLKDILTEFAYSRSGPTAKQIEVLAKSTPSELRDALRFFEGENFPRVVGALLRIGSSDALTFKIRETTRELLNLVGRENALNRLRLKRYGITVEDV